MTHRTPKHFVRNPYQIAFLFREALGVRTRPRVAFSYFESRLLLAATATSLMRGRKNSCWHGELVGSRVCRALVSEEDAGWRTPRLLRTALRSGRSELHVLFRAGTATCRALVRCDAGGVHVRCKVAPTVFVSL